MKKALGMIFALLAFTVVFLFLFRSCAFATDGFLEGGEEIILTDGAEVSDNDDIITENEPSDNEIVENEPSGEVEGLVDDKKSELKEYLEERILPVVIGVLTAVSALCATLFKIRRSLLKIKEARDDFKSEAKVREESFEKQSELLRVKSEELSNIAFELPRLKEQISELEKSTGKIILECGYISQMISLGFGESKDVIKSGSGSKISRLEKECRVILEGDKNEELSK